MTAMEDYNSAEENHEADRKVVLKLLPGGRNINWLRDLAAGTVFASRPKGTKGIILEIYIVNNHSLRTTGLALDSNDLRTVWYTVDTVRFSEANELVEVLGNVEAKTKAIEAPKGDEDEQRDRPNQQE